MLFSVHLTWFSWSLASLRQLRIYFFLEGHASVNCSCFPKKRTVILPILHPAFSFMPLLMGHNILAHSECHEGFE